MFYALSFIISSDVFSNKTAIFNCVYYNLMFWCPNKEYSFYRSIRAVQYPESISLLHRHSIGINLDTYNIRKEKDDL